MRTLNARDMTTTPSMTTDEYYRHLGRETARAGLTTKECRFKTGHAIRLWKIGFLEGEVERKLGEVDEFLRQRGNKEMVK